MIEVVKADDLEVSGRVELSGGLQLTFGKMKKDTAVLVKRHVKESCDFSKLCSDWRWHVLQQDNKKTNDEPDNVAKITEPSKLLQWFQNLVVPVPAPANAKNSKLKNFSISNVKEREPKGGAPPGCCACLSKWFGVSRQSEGGKQLESMETQIDRTDSFLLGYSDDVEIQVDKGQVEGERIEEPSQSGVSFNLVSGLHLNGFDSSKSKEHVKKGVYLPRLEIKSLCEQKIKTSEYTYQGLYCWPRKGKNDPDLYLGEFCDGRFDGYGTVFYCDGGFYKGQWQKDMQSGFGVQRWRSGAVYFGQWKDNKEHGHGVHYCPPIDAPGEQSSEHVSKKPKYSLFIGKFSCGYPTYGLLLEGESVSDMKADDIVLRSENAKSAQANQVNSTSGAAPTGVTGHQKTSSTACRVSRIAFDGRSAFWQQPTPIEQVGEFQARVRSCEYESRELIKTLFTTEKIEDIWYKVVPKSQKEINLMNANPDTEEDVGEQASAPLKPTALAASGGSRLEKLYKTISFHGICVRNKAGYFPCPILGKLFDEDRELDVEYDGKSLLSDNPIPIKLTGALTCTVPVSVQDPRAKDAGPKSMIDHYLGELESVHLLKSPDMPYSIEFRGEFMFQSFARVGILLLSSQIFKVEFDDFINLHRVVRKNIQVKADDDVKKKTTKEKGKTSSKVGSGNTKIQEQAGDAEEFDGDELDRMQIIDFDKLIGKLKFEKKMVEICIGRKSLGTKEEEVAEILHPRDAMKEALKVMSSQLWSQHGTLRQRLNSNPGEAWHVGTHEFEATQGALFHGWFRKVYCPKSGCGDIYPSDKKSLDRSGEMVDNIQMESCLFFPKTEDWTAYFMGKLKSAHVSNLKVSLARGTEEIATIEAEIESQQKIIEQLKFKSRKELKIDPKEIAGPNPMEVITFLHNYLPKIVSSKNEFKDGKDTHEIKRLLKIANARMESLNESLVRQGLATAHTQELVTDIQISEALSAMCAAKKKADLAVEELEDALSDYTEAKHECDEDIKAKSTQLEEVKVASAQRIELAKKALATDPSAKKELEAAAKAKTEAKLAVEIAKRSSDLAMRTTSLARLTSRLLDLIQPVIKMKSAVEAGMHHKSSTRVFSELVLLRRQQWVGLHTDFPGEHRNEKKYLDKLALLKDEYKGMKDILNCSSDDVVSLLYKWSRKVLVLVTEEETLLSTWVKCAMDESSVTPASQSLRAAEKKMEGLVSEAKVELRSRSDEQSSKSGTIAETKMLHLLKNKLIKGCDASKMSSVVREFASDTLKVVKNRLSQAAGMKLQEVNSQAYLNKLEDAIKSFQVPSVECSMPN